MLKLLLLLPLLLLCGCFLTGTKDPESVDPYRARVAVPRTERQLAKKEIVLALLEGPQMESELAKASEIAEKNQLKLIVIRLSKREALPPMLRAGRADLIAGAFTPDEIRQLRLEPAGGSSKDGRTYCFGVRRDDRELAELFGPVTDTLPSGEMPGTAKERKTSP